MKTYILLLISFFILTSSLSFSNPLNRNNPVNTKLPYNLTARNFRLSDSDKVMRFDINLNFTGNWSSSQMILKLDTNIISGLTIEEPMTFKI